MSLCVCVCNAPQHHFEYLLIVIKNNWNCPFNANVHSNPTLSSSMLAEYKLNYLICTDCTLNLCTQLTIVNILQKKNDHNTFHRYLHCDDDSLGQSSRLVMQLHLFSQSLSSSHCSRIVFTATTIIRIRSWSLLSIILNWSKYFQTLFSFPHIATYFFSNSVNTHLTIERQWSYMRIGKRIWWWWSNQYNRGHTKMWNHACHLACSIIMKLEWILKPLIFSYIRLM